MEYADADPRDTRDETEDERHDRNWSEMLQELRVTQTGTQILTGFLLALAFQERFTELNQLQLELYLVLLALAGLSTAIGLAPVVLHRTFFNKRMKDHVVKVGNRLLLAELVVVALLAVGVTSFVFSFIFGPTAGIATASIATVIVLLLWVLLPQLRRRD
jgi:VIT1/CCC1 family predicted Fe2+/Mn2+ transporter